MRYRALFFIALIVAAAVSTASGIASQRAAARRTTANTFAPPPILMYHRVDRTSPDDKISRDLTVTPSQFKEQLAYLKAYRIAAISMADFEDRLAHGRPLNRAVVLTFDDGYADQYWYAVPLLRKFRDDATFYIITGELDKPRHLTWSELRTMARDHMDIAAHGVKHDDLALMSDAQQRYQIGKSIDILRGALHTPIESYAYPSGRFNLETLAIVRSERIPLAVTTDRTNVIPPENSLELPRIRVHGGWRLRDFEKSIQGALVTRHVVLR